jgi:hypothetical protein
LELGDRNDTYDEAGECKKRIFFFIGGERGGTEDIPRLQNFFHAGYDGDIGIVFHFKNNTRTVH